MKRTRRIIAACLAGIMLLCLAACGSGSDSTLTSAQAGLYIETAADGSQSVVTLYGSPADSYSVDKNGNIADSNNKIYVKAENALEFNRITAVSTEQGDTATFELWFNVIVPATADRPATVEATETKFSMPITIEPFDATCQVLTATIDDPKVISFDEEGNNIPSYGSISIDEYGRQTIVVSSNGVGTVQLGLKASSEGNTNIRVATLDGSVSIWIAANVVLNVPGATGSGSGNNTAAGQETEADNKDNPTAGTDGSAGEGGSDAQVENSTPDNVISDSEAGLTTFAASQTMYVLGTNGVNVRSGPGTGYDVIDAIGSGEAVTALGSAGRWVKIKYGELVGYMSSNYLSDTKPAAAAVNNGNAAETNNNNNTGSIIITGDQGGAAVSISGGSNGGTNA